MRWTGFALFFRKFFLITKYDCVGPFINCFPLWFKKSRVFRSMTDGTPYGHVRPECCVSFKPIKYFYKQTKTIILAGTERVTVIDIVMLLTLRSLIKLIKYVIYITSWALCTCLYFFTTILGCVVSRSLASLYSCEVQPQSIDLCNYFSIN